MKLASYLYKERESFGLVIDDGLYDLTERVPSGAKSLVAVLAEDQLAVVREVCAAAVKEISLDQVVLLPPVVRPGKIWCVGVNYRNRAGEVDQAAEPKYPSLFMRTPKAQVGHLQSILKPCESDQLYYEGEIAIIIGRGGRRISEDDALNHIAGYACFNEGSLKDWMTHGVYNVTAGKNFDASGGFGPWMTTADEISDPTAMRLQTRVNGVTVQDDTTANMIAPFSRLISYISTFSRLEPGDVIVTGTPTGSGAKRKPPHWLKPGDIVEVEVDGVGILRNAVATEAP